MTKNNELKNLFNKIEEIVNSSNSKNIGNKYFRQDTVSINFPEYKGIISSHYNIVKPANNKNPNQLPIVLIPGISNDLDCITGLIQELAIHNRSVIAIGYPESSNIGHVTEEFANAVEKGRMFEVHTKYFKKAINNLYKNNQFELWGYSTGGPIVSEILNDKDFQKKVTQAVIINPGSSIDQSTVKIGTQLGLELLEILKKSSKNLPSYIYSITPPNKDISQNILKGKVFASILKRVCKKSEAWKKAKVMPGGNIIFITGKNDLVTKCNQTFSHQSAEFLKQQKINPQLQAIEYAGSHITPLIDPKLILQQITV